MCDARQKKLKKVSYIGPGKTESGRILKGNKKQVLTRAHLLNLTWTMKFFEFLSAYVLEIEALQGRSRATPNLNVYSRYFIP